MIRLILDLAKEFHINPLILLGIILTSYGLLGFHRVNTQLHKKKDEEIDKLKKEVDLHRDKILELELKGSLRNQSGMLYYNEEEFK